MEDEQKHEKKKLATACEECKEKPSKYKCPGCSIRSCSLPCVKAHKQRTGCSGKRSQTHFVPLSHFNDQILLSDYNLLEETKRVAESAQRLRAKLRAYSQFRLPPRLKSLRSAAWNRGIKLFILPSGMSRREKNQSYYNQRKKFISWTIEWRFHNTDVVLLDHGIHEDRLLCSVIEQHLAPGPWNHQLKKFCEQHLGSLKFFIRKYPKGPKSPLLELDIKAPLRQQLANNNLTILEYPVIHVFLPSHTCDFEIVKGVQPISCEPVSKNSICDDLPSPKGVSFKEEEIEDNAGPSETQVYDTVRNEMLSPLSGVPCNNASSETHVYDPVKNESLSPLHEIPCDEITEKSLDGSSVYLPTGCNLYDNSNCIGSPTFEDIIDLDFDQDLIDAYADLIPDEFFNFDGESPNGDGENDTKDLSSFQESTLLQEELEEGEIVE